MCEKSVNLHKEVKMGRNIMNYFARMDEIKEKINKFKKKIEGKEGEVQLLVDFVVIRLMEILEECHKEELLNAEKERQKDLSAQYPPKP